MNRTQKWIAGVAFLLIGLAMVGVVAYNSRATYHLENTDEGTQKVKDLWYNSDNHPFWDWWGMLQKPEFYLGLALGVGGVVVLVGIGKKGKRGSVAPTPER